MSNKMSDNIRKNKDAITKLDKILQDLSSRKAISQQKLNVFYGYLENMYDEDLQRVEDIMLTELSNSNKQEKILNLINIISIDK